MTQDEEPAWAHLPPAPRALASEPPRRFGAAATDEPSPAAALGWTVAVLALAVLAAAALRRFLKRTGLLGNDGPIRVLARRALGPRQDVFLVEVGARRFLIGATRDRLTALGELGREEVAAAPKPKPEGKRGEPAYGEIAGELAEIRKTVESWRA